MDPPDIDKNILPCPLKNGWEVVRTIEIPQKFDNDYQVGGLSGTSYDQLKDILWLISDTDDSYLVRINSFSQNIDSTNPVIKRENINLIRLYDKEGKKLNRLLDGEGLALYNNNAIVLNESKRKQNNIYEPPSILSFNLLNGHLKNKQLLPKSFRYGTSGIESLTKIDGQGFIIATEGKNIHDYYMHPFQKSIKRKLPFLFTKKNIKSYNSSRYVYIKPNLEIQNMHNFKTNGKLRDILAIKDSNYLIILSTKEKVVSLNLYNYEFKRNNLNVMGPVYLWKLKSNRKLEGLTLGPYLDDGKATLLLINDNDLKENRKNIISVLSPIRNKGCKVKAPNISTKYRL